MRARLLAEGLAAQRLQAAAPGLLGRAARSLHGTNSAAAVRLRWPAARWLPLWCFLLPARHGRAGSLPDAAGAPAAAEYLSYRALPSARRFLGPTAPACRPSASPTRPTRPRVRSSRLRRGTSWHARHRSGERGWLGGASDVRRGSRAATLARRAALPHAAAAAAAGRRMRAVCTSAAEPLRKRAWWTRRSPAWAP